MGSDTPPTWLTAIAWLWLSVAFVSAGAIVFDIFLRGHRQRMHLGDVDCRMDHLRACAHRRRPRAVCLTFFEVGLFGWMALMAFVFFPAPHL